MESDEIERGLERFIVRQSGARAARVSNAVRFSGGASRETWAFDADVEGGSRQGQWRGVFRADPEVGASAASVGRRLEYPLIKAAWDRKVAVPEPLWDGDDTFPVNFFTMCQVDGETIGTRIIRDDRYAQAREALTAQLGQSLARIHSVTADSMTPEEAASLADLPGPEPGVSPAATEVNNWEQRYRESTPNPHPLFDLVLRWLHDNLPQVDTLRLVHGDFRLGNLIIDETGLKAVIDWELAHWGDPMEDLGWLCVRSWRFGGKKPVAGIGDRETLFRAYEEAGGAPVDRERVRFWELFGNIRWGIITITQGVRYLSGQNRSVELASIGRRTAETEWELLNILEGKAD